VDFTGIETIDLDTPELPSNDREMLEVVTELMFAYPSVLDTIASVASALHQDEGAGGLAPPATPEAVEGVLEEFAANMESVVIVPPPTSIGEGMAHSCPSPLKQSRPSPMHRLLARLRVLSERRGLLRPDRSLLPRRRSSCRDSPRRPFRSATPPRARQGPPPRRSRRLRRARAQLCRKAPRAVRPRPSSSPAPWAAAFEAGDDAEDDEEAAACNTLERGLAWARCALDELILPATSVSFLV
jgi:hypothetical protein